MARTRTKKQLESELANVKLQAQIATHRLQLQLQESLAYSPPYDLINPWAQLFDGQKLIFPLFPSRWDYRLFNSGIWVSEAQLDLIRMYARFLYDTNLTAKGVIKALENYVIKTGFEYVITSKTDKDSKALVEKVQRFVDDFLTKNHWFERELDFFRRSRRDGEFFARLFPQEDGCSELRIVEPEQVRPPNTDPEWLFGVHVNVDDKETVLGYYVTYDGMIDNGDDVSADEMVQMKLNTDLVIRRGLSDFFCSQEALQGVQKLLRASWMGESVRQALAYIRQYQQATNATVTSLQTANTDYFTPIPNTSGIPQLQPVQIVEPGSIQDIPEGLEFKDGPKGNAANAQIVLQQVYQALAAYWQVPAWMVSGDTGNVNFASSLTAESPFVRNCEKEQKLYANKYKEIIVKALNIGVEQGLLPANTLDEIDLTVHCPPVVVRNAKEETDRNLILNQNGILSSRTWSDREELDPETEKANRQLDGDNVAMQAEPEQRSMTPDAQYARQVNRPE